MITTVEIIGSLGGLGWIASVVGSILLLLSILYLGIWRPYKLHTFYKSLHVKGPPHRPLVGNLADIWTLQRQVLRIKWETADPANLAARCLPHLTYWAKLYGRMFTYTEGAKVNLCVLDTEIIRELLVLKADCYRRSPSGWLWRNSHGASRQSKQDIIDNKMIHCEPERWSTLRRILGPGSDKDHVQTNIMDWDFVTKLVVLCQETVQPCVLHLLFPETEDETNDFVSSENCSHGLLQISIQLRRIHFICRFRNLIHVSSFYAWVSKEK